MNIREIELPGIGKKFEMVTQSNEKVVVIIHHDGTREIYYYDADDHEEVLSNITMNDEEARQMAGILGGMNYKPKELEKIEVTLAEEFAIRWHKVEHGAKAEGRKIGEIGIRHSYGIMIIAIIKKDKTKMLNPGPESIIEEGDTLVISGEKKNIKKAVGELLCKGAG